MWQKSKLKQAKFSRMPFFNSILMKIGSQAKHLLTRKTADKFTVLWQILPIGLNPALYVRRYRYLFNLKKESRILISRHKGNFATETSKFVFFKQIILIVPLGSTDNWSSATGNWFYEIYSSAVDFFPKHNIEVFFIRDYGSSWPEVLYKKVSKNSHTSILSFIESERSDSMNGINFEHLIRLRKIWRGILIGLIFDSVWPNTLNHAFLLSYMDKGVVIVSIDRCVKSALPRNRSQCGPVFLPISKKTIYQFQKISSSTPKSIEFSFIGKTYPSRVHIIDSILKTCQNLEYKYELDNYRPNYSFYITKLASSHFTLNLARANAQSVFQLKCRVLEAALLGTIVVTDEKRYIKKYFPKENFVYFNRPGTIASKMNKLDSTRSKVQVELQTVAESIAPSDFWRKISDSINSTKCLDLD
jgi:hypothetical protein